MKKTLSHRRSLFVLLVAAVIGAKLLIASGPLQKRSAAQSAKKGYKIVNNEAIAEEGFEFVSVSANRLTSCRSTLLGGSPKRQRPRCSAVGARRKTPSYF